MHFFFFLQKLLKIYDLLDKQAEEPALLWFYFV